MIVEISKSSKKNKKQYDARIDGKKTVSFGDSNYQDFTTHKDNDRKQRYIDRHRNNESWGKDGVDTAGFYSKHILWNKPTVQASVADLNNKYKNITFKYISK